MASPDSAPASGTDRLHVVCINYEYDNVATSAGTLLDRYETLVGWAAALTDAGARVSVIQAFARDDEIVRNGVLYRFVRDRVWYYGRLPARPAHLHDAVAKLKPDIVHVNGLQFGRQASYLRRVMPSVPILVQDHANIPPKRWVRRRILQSGLRDLDAMSFVSRAQARPWLEAGLLHEKQSIFEIMEGSSLFRLKSRAEARARTGLSGAPVCLWVGRLNENKDPLTVINGFAKALPALPNAQLVMVHHTDELLPSIRAWLRENPAAAPNIKLLGELTHAALEDVYNSADLFVLGSHREGSGYAVLEGLACGVMPVLTDIPSFRVLTGNGSVGRLWQVGNSDQLAKCLSESFCGVLAVSPQDVRAFFEKNFSWPAIGRHAVAAYRALIGNSDFT
jgi:glycosyltransferase involved in cell wall biosynthesis